MNATNTTNATTSVTMGAVTPPPLYTASPSYAVQMFLACLCAVLIGMGILSIISNARNKKWAYVLCVTFIVLHEICKCSQSGSCACTGSHTQQWGTPFSA
jgi:FtsH-binding integral membrane protein